MNDFELKDITVSFYRHMKSSTMELMTVGRVLNGICSDYYEPQVDKIRKLKDAAMTEEADEIKHNLHAVTFCATFKDRRLSSLYEHYNSLRLLGTRSVCGLLLDVTIWYWMERIGTTMLYERT